MNTDAVQQIVGLLLWTILAMDVALVGAAFVLECSGESHRPQIWSRVARGLPFRRQRPTVKAPCASTGEASLP